MRASNITDGSNTLSTEAVVTIATVLTSVTDGSIGRIGSIGSPIVTNVVTAGADGDGDGSSTTLDSPLKSSTSEGKTWSEQQEGGRGHRTRCWWH